MTFHFYRHTARLLSIISFLFIFMTSQLAVAKTYAISQADQSIIGSTYYITTAPGDSLVNIAQHYDIGFNQISEANPELNAVELLPSGTQVKLPGSFILPAESHKGIIINLAEMRMYYFPQGSDIVMTYPIGIGRVGKTIPIVHTAVVRKAKHPVWIPPADIRAFNEAQGVTLPKIMPAGPDNPLGPYAIYLQLPTYLIHSTIYPDSVGRRASFGCIRMHETDIKDFFPLVTAGVPVLIVDNPNKVGWVNNQLYLETHIPLEEHSHEIYATYDGIVSEIQNTIRNTHHLVLVDWQTVADLAETRDGVPHNIGFTVH